MFININKRLPTNQQHGFTILELMIASSVFMVILVVIAVGVISFSNSYYKGITASKTQSTARTIMSLLTSSIQTGKQVTQTYVSPYYGLCVDDTFFVYATGLQVTDTRPSGPHQAYHGLVESTIPNCAGTSPTAPPFLLPAGSRELLGQHMRLSDLNISSSGKTYTIHLKVVYGDDALLTTTTPPNETCQGGIAGEQFCAVSELTTTVQQRL